MRRYFKKMEQADIQVKSISTMLEMYNDDCFVVNRDYQRKLVWTLEEKVKLIDTILNGYTVPMFLFGASINPAGKEQLEIIDGLQRLDAIFSFIFNEFAIVVNGEKMYFNLDCHYITMEMRDKGLIHQKKPAMDLKTCEKFKAFNLALSITRAPKKFIEETFRRVNSSGKRLSSQDLRQAGVSNKFSKMVNRIATEVRRDVSTSNVLSLDSMKKISISNHGLRYGIAVKSIFWVKQGIIIPDNIRDSRDEELISRILSRVVLGTATGNSSSTLNTLYKEDSTLSKAFDEKVEELGGEDIIIKNIVSVIELFAEIFKKQSFSAALEQKGNVKIEGKRNIFLVVFLVLYDKIYKEGKKLDNAEAVVSVVKNAFSEGTDKYKKINTSFNRYVREDCVDSLSNDLECCFKSNDKDEQAGNFINLDVKEFECLVHNASLEHQMLDYKIATCDLGTGNPNKKCISKIVKTLIAMANTNFDQTGYVILGVANTEADAKKYEKLFGVKANRYADLFITGVEGEAGGDLDGFIRKLVQGIEKEPISAEAKSAICRTFQRLEYHGHTILIFSLKFNNTLLSYDNEYCERHGSSVYTIKTGTEEFNALLARFVDYNSRKNVSEQL